MSHLHNNYFVENKSKDTPLINTSMSAQSALNLTITRDAEYVSAPSTNLYELIDPAMLKVLLRHPDLMKEWSDDDWFHQQVKATNQTLLNEVEQVKQYGKLADKNGLIRVAYKKSKHNFGRAYIQKSLGFTCLRIPVRNTLLNDRYIDVDMENAQLRILLCLMKSIDYKDVVHLNMYCDNRKAILAEVMATYQCSRDVAKNLFLSLTFGGRFEDWIRRNKVAITTPYALADCFKTELFDVAKLLRTHNPDLYEAVRQQNKAKGKDTDNGNLKSFLSVYLGHWECKVISTCLSYLANETDALDYMGVKVGTYEYDGVKLLAEGYARFCAKYGKMEDALNQLVLDRLGLDVRFVVKPIEEKMDLSLSPPEPVEPETPLDEKVLNLYKQIKDLDNESAYAEYLEKTYPKKFLFEEGEGKDGKWRCWNGTKWENSNICLRQHISYITPTLMETQFAELKEFGDKLKAKQAKYKAEKTPEDEQEFSELEWTYLKMSKFILGNSKTPSFKDRCGSAFKIKAILYNAQMFMRNLTIKFDANPYLTGFENGVYDLEKHRFRPYEYDDFVSLSMRCDLVPILKDMTIGKVADADDVKNFEDVKLGEYFTYQCSGKMDDDDEQALGDLWGQGTEGEEDYEKGLIQKIWADKNVRELCLSIYSKIFWGNALEYVAVFNGTGGNAKGFFDSLVAFCGGDYVAGKVDYGLITEKKVGVAAANPALVMFRNKRLAIMTEPDSSTRINNEAFKELSGGDAICARDLYKGAGEMSFDATHMLLLECNDRLLFKNVPQLKGAEHRRLIDVEFASRFTNFEEDWNEEKNVYPADASLKETKWREAHRNVLLNILIKYARMMSEKKWKFDIPECVKLRVEAYLESCNDLHTIFKEHYARIPEEEFDENDLSHYVSVPNMVKHIRECESFRELDKAKKSKFSATYVKDFYHTNECYRGRASTTRRDITDPKTGIAYTFKDYLWGFKKTTFTNTDE
jgi:phage/plasmid-associated DNA primase